MRHDSKTSLRLEAKYSGRMPNFFSSRNNLLENSQIFRFLRYFPLLTKNRNRRNVTLDEWEMQSQKNILSAAKELNGARPLRCYIDKILKQIVDDLNAQKDATDNAFRGRVDEIKEAKTKLELQHSEVRIALHSHVAVFIIRMILLRNVFHGIIDNEERRNNNS